MYIYHGTEMSGQKDFEKDDRKKNRTREKKHDFLKLDVQKVSEQKKK